MSQSNASGKCINCGFYFIQLAVHMLSSEKCMLASQDSLHNKRNRSDYNLDEVPTNTSLSEWSNSVAKKNGTNIDDHHTISRSAQLF